MKRRFIITAGPTREFLDPVRFLSNPSTGRMGYAIARAAAAKGYEVELVSGPVALRTPKGVVRHDVVSARDMKRSVDLLLNQPFDGKTFFIATAAVADWRPKKIAAKKLKKSEMSSVLELERNPDILKSVKGAIKIGFAAETGSNIEEAKRKCRDKDAAMIVFNDVTSPGAGFGTITNRVVFVCADGRSEVLPLMTKDAIGRRIVKFCEAL